MVAISTAKLQHELDRRGLTRERLAELSGVPVVTINAGLARGNFRQSTLVKLMDGLNRAPVIEGLDAVLA